MRHPKHTWDLLSETTEHLDRSGQTYGGVLIYSLANLSPSRRVKVVIHWDSYAFQSRYNVSLWTGTEWSLVASIFGTDEIAQGMANGYGPPDTARPLKVASINDMADELLARLEDVIFL